MRWLTPRGHMTMSRLDEDGFYELLDEYLAERAGEEFLIGPYR